MRLPYIAAIILAVLSTALAAPANPEPSVYFQPDGTETPLIYLRGNQLYSWLADEKGYTVIKDEQGWYNYAIKTIDGDIVSSGVKIGSKNPKKLGISPGLLHEEHKRPIHGLEQATASTTERRSLLQVPENALCGFAGSKDNPCRLKGIVFLVQFSDHANRVLPTQQDYDVLFNNNGPDNATAPTGSVFDVFFANSYQTFVMESTVTPWIKVPRTEAQTVGGNLGLNTDETKKTWTTAIGMYDKMGLSDLDSFDKDKDGVFDCLVIMHSGAASESGGIDCETGKDNTGRIWSHATASDLYYTAGGITRVDRFYVASGVFGVCPPGGKGTKWNIARIAVIAHECAHFLGLPDLYDTVGGLGVGNYDLMANMWGWNSNQWYPPLMGAWSKLKLGWSNVVHVKGPGTHVFDMNQACTSAEILYVDHRLNDGEYFLIEYRFPCGFDLELGIKVDWRRDRSGAAIWHIDESGIQPEVNYQSEGIPGKSKIHYAVALVQGDGNFNLEREQAYGGNKGDQFDLLMDCVTYKCGKSKRIDNFGITKADGTKLAQPNTKGYSNGTEYDTGIAISVGLYGAKLNVNITLEGIDSQPNTYPGIDSKGLSSGLSIRRSTPSPFSTPTPLPTTSAPTRQPTIALTQPPTRSPTLAPTPSPTTLPLSPPTPLPTTPPSSQPLSPPTPFPTSMPTPYPTALPTRFPTPLPTLSPTPPPSFSPTPQPTPSPSDQPTPSPTPQPTSSPTPPPTPSPLSPPTPAPSMPVLQATTFAPVQYQFNVLQDEATWEARFGGHGVVTNVEAYRTFYGLTSQITNYTGLTVDNRQIELLNIPVNCQKRDSNFTVTYKGVGADPNAIKIKHCGWFVGNTAKFCPLLDLDPQRSVNGYRARVWQVCQQECKEFTRCDVKMASI